MPEKRRTRKGRTDKRTEAEAWGCIFEVGYDFFGDLPRMGITLDRHGMAFEGETRDAWHRLGRIWLATRDPILADRPPWAVEQFGEPPCP